MDTTMSACVAAQAAWARGDEATMRAHAALCPSCAASLASGERPSDAAGALVQLEPGTVFAGDYRVESLLRTGGMGAVYVATQLSTGTRRALKLMLPSLASKQAARGRFEQEARVGARIPSEHVVQVIGAGVDAATGAPWIAMELLQGEELMDRVVRAGPLPRADARVLFEQLRHAVGAAHRARIVHRDLKPENVFLALPRSAGAAPFTVKVLDFGIAKVTSEAIARNTSTIGTPLWMAPEQTSPGQEITPATDVWALGLIAYHALTGRSFWRAASDAAGTMTALLRELLVDPIPPASERAAEQGVEQRLPRGFDRWFARCVAREAGERFADGDEALAALAPMLRDDAAGPEATREAPPEVVAEPVAGVPARGGRKGLRVAAVAAAAVLAVGAVGWSRLASAPARQPVDPAASDPRAALAAGQPSWRDLVLPQWTDRDEACDTAGPAVVVTPTGVLAGDPPRRLFELVDHEPPAAARRPGAASLLVPLAAELQRTPVDRVLVLADAATRYRLLYDVLETLAAADAKRWDLAVAHDGRPRSFALYPPPTPRTDHPAVMVLAMADRFEAYVSPDLVKPAWVPLAARCEARGDVPIPLRDRAQIDECLAGVLRTSGKVAPVVCANPEVPYGRVLTAVGALRAAQGNAQFAPPM